jgi:alpha-ketoglutarate-dependent taurine dioxygenase
MNIQFSPLAETFGILAESFSQDSLLDLDRNEITDRFRKSGLLMFRGFAIDTDTFKAFSSQLGKDFGSYAAGAYSRKVIAGDKTLLSVAGHHKMAEQFPALPFHGEMYYVENNPKMIWFYCNNPAESGGETLFCDGIQVYKELSRATRHLFDTKPLKYIRHYLDGAWQKIYQTEDLGLVDSICHANNMTLKVNEDRSITTEYVRSAVLESRDSTDKVFINNILPVYEQELEGQQASLVRFEDGSKISSEIIEEIREVTKKLAIAISWQKGDTVMFDNTRLLHARRAFCDANREIFVRLCNPAFSL